MSLDKDFERPATPEHMHTIVRYSVDLAAGALVKHTWIYYAHETPFEEVVPNYTPRSGKPGVPFRNQWLSMRSDKPPAHWERRPGWSAWLNSLDDDNVYETCRGAAGVLLRFLGARRREIDAQVDAVTQQVQDEARPR